ncbi:hypothetical protein BGZ57DRAFT_553856 [Hyaloscypha finlandica]|nr:hypothetical protein BGZ57DRAFT_553856 [Hyaloscypha finlandica]
MPTPHVSLVAFPVFKRTSEPPPSTFPGYFPSSLAQQTNQENQKSHRFPQPRVSGLGLSLGEIRCLVRPNYRVLYPLHSTSIPLFSPSSLSSPPVQECQKDGLQGPRKPFPRGTREAGTDGRTELVARAIHMRCDVPSPFVFCFCGAVFSEGLGGKRSETADRCRRLWCWVACLRREGVAWYAFRGIYKSFCCGNKFSFLSFHIRVNNTST